MQYEKNKKGAVVMDQKFGFVLKFYDCAENEIEIYSDEEIEGKVVWPSYSQAEPVRLRGVFATAEEAEEAAKNAKVYKAVMTYDHGDFEEEEDSVDGFGEGGLDFPAYFFSPSEAEPWINCRLDNSENTTYEILEIEIADIEVFEIG